MDALLMAAGAILGAIIGLGGGYLLGHVVRSRRAWLFWLVNAGWFSLGTFVGALGLVQDSNWIFIGAVAFMGAAFTGTKYGYEKVIAPWEVKKMAEEEREHQ